MGRSHKGATRRDSMPSDLTPRSRSLYRPVLMGDRICAGPPGAAWRSALGAALLRADRWADGGDGDHPDPRAGVLFDFGAGSQGHQVGSGASLMTVSTLGRAMPNKVYWLLSPCLSWSLERPVAEWRLQPSNGEPATHCATVSSNPPHQIPGIRPEYIGCRTME